jgi:uncharacterized protein YbaR (Trm112 family)
MKKDHLKLLPCPKCKENVDWEMVYVFDEIGQRKGYDRIQLRIFCKCGIKMSSPVFDFDSDTLDEDTRTEFENSWNDRK